MKVARKLATGAPDAQAWRALSGGAWAGPVQVADGGARYEGALRLVDADEDSRRAGVYAQVRRVAGFGGVAVNLQAQIAGAAASRTVVLLGDASVTGDVPMAAADALVAEVEARIERAVRDLDGSPADDPAWRRRLAMRAVVAVGVGVAAGLAGAAWDRRRRA